MGSVLDLEVLVYDYGFVSRCEKPQNGHPEMVIFPGVKRAYLSFAYPILNQCCFFPFNMTNFMDFVGSPISRTPFLYIAAVGQGCTAQCRRAAPPRVGHSKGTSGVIFCGHGSIKYIEYIEYVYIYMYTHMNIQFHHDWPITKFFCDLQNIDMAS
jgi:hypothetical protein